MSQRTAECAPDDGLPDIRDHRPAYRCAHAGYLLEDKATISISVAAPAAMTITTVNALRRYFLYAGCFSRSAANSRANGFEKMRINAVARLRTPIVAPQMTPTCTGPAKLQNAKAADPAE